MNLSKESIINKLTELKPYLAKEFAVKSLGLFGSFAEGNNNEASDVDILVELEKPIGWKFFSLEIYLEEKLGRRIDLVTKNSIRNALKQRILNQLIQI